jgi:glycine/D-amino acid oxidase-like deaminating enzyme
MMVDYYHATRDGRVAFGKGGWGIAYRGRIGPAFDRDARRARTVEADLRRTYPMLADVRVTHDWCGPIDRTRNSLPLLGRFEKAPHIAYGVGWSGNGVGPSVIGGKILASLVLERDDAWGRHPLIGRIAGRFPPEPIRFIGAHVVRGAVARKERAEIAGRRPSRIDVALSRLAPAGVEDKAAPDGTQRISRR